MSDNQGSSKDSMWGALDGNAPSANSSNQNSNKNKKNITIGASVLAGVLVLGGLGFAVLGGGADPVVNDATPIETTETLTPTPTPDPTTITYPVAPISLDTWQKEMRNTDATKITVDQEKWAANQVAETPLDSVARINLGSEELGYTSDVSQAKDEYGLPNPLYSFWTQDIFITQSTLAVEALINPTFGGWADHQRPNSNASENFQPRIFRDIFSASYQKKYFKNKDKSYLPVLADWNNDSYGRTEIYEAGGAYWFGEITGAESKWKYNTKTLTYTVDAVYQIKYTGYTANQQKTTRNGVLTIKWVPNNGTLSKDSEYRVVIGEAKLVLK